MPMSLVNRLQTEVIELLIDFLDKVNSINFGFILSTHDD